MVNKAKIFLQYHTIKLRVWDPSDPDEAYSDLFQIQQILATKPPVSYFGFKSSGPYSLVNFGPKLSKQIKVS